jgi:hypothetical protein
VSIYYRFSILLKRGPARGPRAPNLQQMYANLAPLPPFYQQGGQGGVPVTYPEFICTFRSGFLAGGIGE